MKCLLSYLVQTYNKKKYAIETKRKIMEEMCPMSNNRNDAYTQ